jgi:hypothetical protein
MEQQRGLVLRKSKIKIMMIYLSFRIIIDIIYINWVSPTYEYMGLLLEPNILKILISYILLIICLWIIPKNEKKISHIILQLHLIIMILPLSSVFGLANQSLIFMLMIFASFFLQILLIRFLPNLRVKKIKNAKMFNFTMFFSLTFITYLYMLKTQNINLTAFDISSIYEIRSNRDISLIFNYLITWQFRIINPLIIVLSYVKRNYSLLIIGIILQILMYLMYPNKEVFLSVILILFCLFIVKRNYRFDTTFIYILSIGTAISVIIFEVFKNISFVFILVRLLHLPAIIKFWHYEHFLVHDKLYYSEGMIGKVLGLDYPYSLPTGFLIKDGFLGQANTGYLAYAYDNAGFVGMIVISLIFVGILKLLDSLVINENKKIIFALLVYPMIILNDGDLLTLVLTGGVFLLIVGLFLHKNIADTSDK